MNPSTTIRLALATTAATALFAAGPAMANPKPAPAGAAVHTSSLSLEPFVGVVGTDPVVVGSGDVAVEIDQTGVNNPVVMVDINLPVGLAWAGDQSATVARITSNEDSGSCGGTAVIGFSDRTVTAKDFSCTDTDNDGAVEFTFSVVGGAVESTIAVEGEYPLSSQYRTNPSRKVKDQTWVVATADVVEVAAPEESVG